MEYKEAVEYLNSLNRYGSILGLGSIRKLLGQLSNPQNQVKTIHIAGTNGKGSVSAFLESILVSSGYKVGRYSSPAVYDSLEIIRLNCQNISKENFADVITTVEKSCKEMVKAGFEHPTRFEVETAAAFLFFKLQQCDVAIIECGLGGRDDATNVILKPECAVITSISYDHVGVLGNTLKEIAANKAGIIMPGCEVVYLSQKKDVNDVIETVSETKNARVHPASGDEIHDVRFEKEKGIVFSYKDLSDVRIGLAGAYQPENAAVAIECAKVMAQKNFGNVTEQTIRKGLMETVWFGRFNFLGTSPDFIIDGAHNPDGAVKLSESLEKYYSTGSLVFIIGVFKDKDYKKILEPVMKFAFAVITIQTPDNERALDKDLLKEYIEQNYDVQTVNADGIRDAVDKALRLADGKSGVAAFGSLSHLRLINDEYYNLTR